ncbi:YajQ family cyclic di-GMP-binding protein [Campylobacter sp. LR291e]|uniref:YajQ family cyclic di-GMP-binding protein n=1 Tax=unclassified Campylobacter TaxID=2593542 RepID=UPI001237BD9C|nr:MULTISPECIES: YajQ family cyclic di-GMP-binding protein [unclassified Campylobacter]KAA6227504.1 YajQ family cyclic di-GMP-binding protein [Campylobacter sp. LR196d]KAA6228144.1 YajQ family cyclic di-GMP-binding protein [Campylobacter sp. LR185c]KAA6230921.1 YajQ family cyclic di-GMP-binding protein [Campylobacter sp. LR291e]KAA6233555.1 YajQ family cyclic di-GMP-binding protein [Campylobacter sp. LR264d]KAA8603840.1 YajQ family cyclic di-GMP-binding protein [Campylobacter sp. LR185c]
MASEHSFDISASVDLQELKNALEQAKKEVENRYDLKGVKTEFLLDEKQNIFKLRSSSETKLEILKDILISKLIKRGLNSNAIKELSKESGAMFSLNLKVNSSIDSENAKKINKTIKDSKLKVNSSIRGDEIRVVAKQIDDLQAVISLVKGLNLELTLSFKNLK